MTNPANQTKNSNPMPRPTTSEQATNPPPTPHNTPTNPAQPTPTSHPETIATPSAREASRMWALTHCYHDAVWYTTDEQQVIAVMVTVMGQAQLLRAGVTEAEGVHERWSYPALQAALAALEVWVSIGFEGEPQGWVRHQPSNRRRVHGDPLTESVWP